MKLKIYIKIVSHIARHICMLYICEITIFVDGGSTDNTTEIANNLVDHILKTKSGRAIQQNIGASIARGNIFLFLHADTYITDKTITIYKKYKQR